MTKPCRTPRARSSRVRKPVAAACGRHAITRSRTVVLPIPGGPVMSRLAGGITRMSHRRLAPCSPAEGSLFHLSAAALTFVFPSPKYGVPERRGIMRAATKAEWEAVAVEVGSAVAIPLLGTVAAGLPFQAFPVEGTLELPAGLWGGPTGFALPPRGPPTVREGLPRGGGPVREPR